MLESSVVDLKEAQRLFIENPHGQGIACEEKTEIGFAGLLRGDDEGSCVAQGFLFKRARDSHWQPAKLIFRDVVGDAAANALDGEIFAKRAGN